MQTRHHRAEQRSTTVGSPTLYIEVEAAFRHAGRLLEVAGVTDPEAARLSGVAFRLASRVRSDRLDRAA